MSNEPMGLWPYLESELKARGWTAHHLAKVSGIPYPRMHSWTQGSDLSRQNARKLAEALGVPLFKILWEAGWYTKEELGERIVVGGKTTLDNFSEEELLAELQRRIAKRNLRQTM